MNYSSTQLKSEININKSTLEGEIEKIKNFINDRLDKIQINEGLEQEIESLNKKVNKLEKLTESLNDILG